MAFRWAEVTERGRNWWVAAGLGAVLGGLLAFTLAVWPELQWNLVSSGLWPTSSGDWAAWAQAGGTVVAIMAAARIANWQLQRAAEHEAERHRRDTTARSRAAFVTLPNDLSTICKYLKLCAELVTENTPVGDDRVARSENREGYVIPVLPDGLFQRVREDIPFLDEKPADAISEIMANYQVQNVRLRDVNDVNYRPYAEDLLRDGAELYVMVNALFNYARKRGKVGIDDLYDEAAVHNGVLNLLPLLHRERWRDPLKERLMRRSGRPIFGEETN